MVRFVLHCFWYVCLLLWSLLIGIASLPLLFGPEQWLFKLSRVWVWGFLKGMRWFLNVDSQIHGLEHLPTQGSFILACKHQSSWETLIFSTFLNNPVFFIKRSLLYFPFLGLILKKLRMIVVDRGRSSRGSFLKRAAIEASLMRPIIIFPEGTRTSPGQTKAYHGGVFALARTLDVPVIPVALNSGVFWPRRGFLKNPGIIEMTFLPPMPRGLTKEAFMSQLHETIETQSSLLTERAQTASLPLSCMLRALFAAAVLFFSTLSIFSSLADRFICGTSLGLGWVWILDSIHMRPSAMPLREEYVRALHQLLKDIGHTLNVCKVLYWIDGGTLLGAMRHGGFIPWDDDADLQISHSDKKILEEKVIPILKGLGYGVRSLTNNSGVAIFCQPDQWQQHHTYETPPSCDIFFAKKDKDNFYRLSEFSQALKHDEIFPLKSYTFGSLQLMGPQHPNGYLCRLYGKNWPYLAKRGEDHYTTDGRQKSRFYFLVKDPKPLLPQGELKNHESLINDLFSKL